MKIVPVKEIQNIKIFSINELESLNDKELFFYSNFIGRNARKWKRLFVATIPEIFKRELYKKKFYSIYEYGAKVGGLSHNVVREALRINNCLIDKPKLKSLIGKIGINKLRIVANIATKETDEFWAEKVELFSRNALSVYVQELKRANQLVDNKLNFKSAGSLIDKKLNFNDEKSHPGMTLENGTKDSQLVKEENERSSASVQFSVFDNMSNECSDGRDSISAIGSGERNTMSAIGSDENENNFPHEHPKKHFGFKIENETEFKLLLYRQWLEKQRKVKVDINEAIKTLIETVEVHTNFGKRFNR